MQFNPADMKIREVYSLMVQLITPRPIAWVSTVSNNGVTNLAPYSFFNGVGASPPSVMFCPANRRDGSRKHSLTNVLETKEFVVNLVAFDDAETMNQTSADYADDQSEIDALAIDTIKSSLVRPVRVRSSLAQFECKLLKHLELGDGPAGANVVIGEVVMMHVDESVIEGNRIDILQLDSVGRLGGKSYTRTTDNFELDRPSVPEKK